MVLQEESDHSHPLPAFQLELAGPAQGAEGRDERERGHVRPTEQTQPMAQGWLLDVCCGWLVG